MVQTVTVLPKGALSSKINWVAILTVAAGIGSFSDTVPASARPWILLVVGVANLVLRTFFTKRPVEIGAGA